MKRTLYLIMILMIGLCLALPSMSFAKSNRGAVKGYNMDRSQERQNYRQERNMYQNQYRYEYQNQKMPKEQYRQQNRLEAPEKDQLRKQVRDPSTHLPIEETAPQ